jgi:Envelope integrity protein A
MIVSLRVAAIAGLMAVAATPVMAQTTGTLPAQPPPYGVAPPLTALTANNIVVVPIRSGIGLRLGANLGYLKFTDSPTWNPF